MDEAAESGIRLRGISKRYGNTVALDGLDLDIVPGEILGVAGPNGAGKSTLVRMIGGEESPSSGALALDGKPWSPTADWHAVAIVHQEPQLFPNLTVAENMIAGREGGARAWPKPGAHDVEVMEALGMSRVTARRYLEYLADAGTVSRTARYGAPGRPENEYRWSRTAS